MAIIKGPNQLVVGNHCYYCTPCLLSPSLSYQLVSIKSTPHTPNSTRQDQLDLFPNPLVPVWYYRTFRILYPAVSHFRDDSRQTMSRPPCRMDLRGFPASGMIGCGRWVYWSEGYEWCLPSNVGMSS